jgi:hypothetical protein
MITKKQIQQKVLYEGKPLALNKFTWDGKTKTFSSNVCGLVIDFSDIDGCTIYCDDYNAINCGSDNTIICRDDNTINGGDNNKIYCRDGNSIDGGNYNSINCGNHNKINCGNYNSINCGYDNTIDGGYDNRIDCGNHNSINCRDGNKIDGGNYNSINCRNKNKIDCSNNNSINGCNKNTIDCSYYSKINCSGTDNAVINRNVFEVITLEKDTEYKICPYEIEGHLKGGIYSKTNTECIIIDNMLSEIISQKGNVYKVKNYNKNTKSFDNEISYIVQDGDIYSHGETIKEARDSLVYKISNRDTSIYKDLKLDSILTKTDAIKCYRVITGSCEFGVKSFVESVNIDKDNFTIQEIIDITKGQYGNDVFMDFFNNLTK